MKCCGNCMHHEIGQSKTIVRTVRKDGKMVEISYPISQYGGHLGHENGKCRSFESPRHGVVTGYHGGCAFWAEVASRFEEREWPEPVLEG